MNATIGTTLKKLRQERNLTLDRLSELLNEHYKGQFNFNKGKLSKWENDKEEPRLSSIKMLTDFYEISIDELYAPTVNTKYNISTLFNKLEQPRQEIVYNFAQEQFLEQNHILPFISKSEYNEKIQEENGLYKVSKTSSLSAGTGIVDLDPTYMEDVYVASPPPDNYDMAFQVSGNSMEPLFEDGEMIYVKKTTELSNGQIVAITINGESYIKKAYKGSYLRLVSLNKDYGDIIAREIDDILLIGKVVF